MAHLQLMSGFLVEALNPAQGSEGRMTYGGLRLCQGDSVNPPEEAERKRLSGAEKDRKPSSQPLSTQAPALNLNVAKLSASR